MPTKLKLSDLSVSGEKATISGAAAAALTQSLISRPVETYGELASSFGYISPSDIEVQQDGRLIITNKRAAERMQSIVSNLSGGGDDGGGSWFDTNCSCSNPNCV